MRPQLDDLVQTISDLVTDREQLTGQAYQQYAPEVEAILREECRDPKRIEHLLDGILDFCFDPDMLDLYKTLCRYYYQINPQVTASYVYAYRDMWDEEEGKKGRNERHYGFFD